MKFTAVFLLALALAACTQGYQNALRPEAARTLRLTGIEVDAQNANLNWGAGARAYAESIGQPDNAQNLAPTPQAQAFMQALAAQRIKAAFERAFVGRMQSGTKLVRIVVNVKKIAIASAIQRVLLGGDYEMTASVNLVDGESGEVLVPNSNLSTKMPAGNGVAGVLIDPLFGQPVDRLAANLAKSYVKRLLPKHDDIAKRAQFQHST